MIFYSFRYGGLVLVLKKAFWKNHSKVEFLGCMELWKGVVVYRNPPTWNHFFVCLCFPSFSWGSRLILLPAFYFEDEVLIDFHRKLFEYNISLSPLQFSSYIPIFFILFHNLRITFMTGKEGEIIKKVLFYKKRSEPKHKSPSKEIINFITQNVYPSNLFIK